MITATATQIHANPEIRARKTWHLFEAKKEKEILLGRIKRNKIYLNEAWYIEFEKKDVIKKGVYNNFLELTNKNIKDSKDEEIKKRQIKLGKVDNSVIEVASKNDNLKLIKIKMKMKDILCNTLSNNHRKIDKNYKK